jgi:hypothetical protein
MQKFIFTFIAAGIIISCNPKQTQPQPAKSADNTAVDSAAIVTDPKNNLAVQASSFSEIDSSGILLFPLSLGETGRDKGGSFSYKDMPGSSYWNIIFYNAKTGAYHLLSERKMLISSFESKYSSVDAGGLAYSAKYIFYEVITDDYNGDKKLDGNDPQYLFVSDKEGANFRQISPSGFDMRSWQFIKSAGKVLITATKDSDNNKGFGGDDELVVFSADMDSAAPAKEIFPQAFTNKLKLLYDKDWKELKK